MSKKVSFFLYSEYGSTLFLAKRLKAEGHPVLLYIEEDAAQDVGKGLVPKTTNPVPPRDFIVIFDSVGHGKVGQELRKAGHRVIGGNPLDKPLESDRPEGAKIMQRHGIRTPQAFEFRAIPTAIKFLDGKDGHWFVKAIGTDTPESYTYDDTVEELQRYLRHMTGKLDHFQLSQKASGTEISTNGWFDGQKWVPPFDHTLEEKRYATGNLGPRTGCESNLVWFAQTPTLAKETLYPLENFLRREGYVGPLDLNALIDTDGNPLGLEWTARLGFDAFQAWCHLLPKVGEQLEAFAEGSLRAWEPLGQDFAMTLRVSMPPYPLWEPGVAKKSKGLPLDPRWLTSPTLTVDDVMLGPDGPQMAGRDGYIGTVGAIGDDVATLKKEVLDLAKTIRVPNKHYRTDPVSRATKDLTELSRLGLVGHPGLSKQFEKGVGIGHRTL